MMYPCTYTWKAPAKVERFGINFHGGDDESGGVFAVETFAPAGKVLESHQHEHSHMSVLASGVADVTIDGVTQRHQGPCVLTVPANTVHKVVAVSDVVWYCLWADAIAPKGKAHESLKLV